jgi:hypothetical protein
MSACAIILLFFLLEQQLRLGDNSRKLSIAAHDPGLQNHSRSAAVQWNAYRARSVAQVDSCKKICLALDCGGTASGWKTAARGHAAQSVPESHHRAPMKHATTIAQLLPYREFRLTALGRALVDL